MTQLQKSNQLPLSGVSCPDWRSLLCENVTDLAELCEILRLPSSIVSAEAAAIQPLNVTRDYLSRIEPANPNDPLLLQILPRRDELETVHGFSDDPLDESSCIKNSNWAILSCRHQAGTKNEYNPVDALSQLPVLQKYPGRALILTTDRCATHCRFCFRRNFLKKKPALCLPDEIDDKRQQYSTKFLKNSDEISDIREIILSGGDPLMLDDDELEGVFNYIKDLHPGNRVRLHTRMPVLLPERVTPQLVELLIRYRLDPSGGAVYVVLHVNHANELSDKVADAIGRFVDAGIPVLSQTVLLRNVNDVFETLYDLFEKLANLRIIPYYLHQLDRVHGAAHFEVPTAKGLVLLSKLSATLPGYAVPRYVQEIPGESKKTRL